MSSKNSPSVVRPSDALALARVLKALFPELGGLGPPEELEGDALGFHRVMREFASAFRARNASEAQLQGLARLLEVCVVQTDSLENAVSTCFLEHLQQIDRGELLWRHLSTKVREHAKA